MEREGVAEALALVGDPGGVLREVGRVPGQVDAEDHERLSGEPEPVQRLARPRAALERRAEQVRPQPSLHVGARADAQQVEGDQLRGLAERLGPLLAERPGHRGPDRAEHLVTGPDRDGDAGHRERVVAVGGGADEDGTVCAVEVPEHPALVEDPGVALRHLPTQDRLDPRGVRLVLPAREGQHPGAAVLDGDRGVEQGRDRVRDGEQVTRGQPAERLLSSDAHVALGEQGAQHRREVGPRRAAAQPEHGDPGAVGGGPDLGGRRHRRPQHQAHGAGGAEVAEERDDLLGRLDADAEDERTARQHRRVDRVVDDHAADLAGALGIAVDEV
ncbi:MAG: hypothetical protein KDF24_01705, partial [Rhodocyclaceae bacterium]|nr:hypothetical protein [Rhodocyclaceae bacterium]